MKLKDSIIIILAVVIAIILGVLFGINIAGDNDTNLNVNKNEANGNVENISLSDSDKIRYNEEFERKMYIPLTSIIDLQVKDIEFNKNYLESIQNKLLLVWSLSITDENVRKYEDFNIDGEPETGAMAINTDDFIAKYFEIFGETIDIKNILQYMNDIRLKNNLLYGRFSSGWTLDFLLKTKSVSYDKDNNISQVTFDLITKFTSEFSNGKYYNEFDYDAFLNYQGYNVLNYPKEIIYAKLLLGLEKSGEKHIIKYIKFVK